MENMEIVLQKTAGKMMETWSGNRNHAGHAKGQCYVMLGFSVKVRHYQEPKLNMYVSIGGPPRAVRVTKKVGKTYPGGQYPSQKVNCKR